MIKKGDILLVHSYFDPIGWIISFVTKSKWTHTTWVLNEKYILESRSIGVVKTPIKKYLNKYLYCVKLLRIKELEQKKIKLAMKFAEDLYDHRNYFKFIWTLILIGFGYVRRKPIMSCSGFVAYCLSQVGFYFKKEKNPLLITPADISNSKGVKNVSGEISNFTSSIQ